jgi:hypothetical protein
MIGRMKGHGWTATLEDDGRWSCADDLIALFLEVEFNRDTYSEADGVFGLRLLNDAAARLGGTVEGAKSAGDAESGDERDIVLSVYICEEGHLHVGTRGQDGLADDRIIGSADDWPDLKAVCRDELGRFAPCGGGGSGGSGRTERERREEGERKLEKARQLIKEIRGGPQPVPHSRIIELHNHLGTMTVAQMHQIKREHDLKASGKDKAALQAKLAARFARIPPGGSPRPDAQVPKGTFGQPKNLQWPADVEDYAHEVARDLLGGKARANDLLACAGAPDGARVLDVQRVRSPDTGSTQVSVDYTGKLKITDPNTGKVTEEEYTASRVLVRDADGNKYIMNSSFEGKGAGLGMLGRQVENASRHGFGHIETYAAGFGGGITGQRNPDSPYNGYYTWPRFGYQGNVIKYHLDKMPPELRADVAQAGGKISGLMATKAGRDWWLGHGDSLSATFDLRPGSYSQRTLLSNLKERGIVK